MTDPAAAGATISFDIPAQPLDQALLVYGRAADVQVLYDAGLVHGQRSSEVKGAFHAREALELLLRGTGLRVRYTSPTAVTLAPIVNAQNQVLRMQSMRVEGAPEVLDQSRLIAYAERVQERIAKALQQSFATRHIAFDLTIHVWLGGDGSIKKSLLISSDVPHDQAEAILAVVNATTTGEPPPAGLPQPIGFRFRSHPAY